MPEKTLIVVAGPTAVGKTEVCIRLARHFKTEIISADSRQLFKEMSIGTAKPSGEEMQGVKHHFIDSHTIHEAYSAGRYEAESMELIEDLFRVYDTLILTGGSGLYIKAVCQGFDTLPDAVPEIRDDLNRIFEEEGIEILLKELQQADPLYYEQADRSNSRRIIRALEVFRATGKPYSAFRKSEAKKRPFRIIKIALNRERKDLYERINRRVEDMLVRGLKQEAERLYPYKDHSALQTVGYEEIFGFMEGKYDWEETVRLLKRNTRRYAKRQMTWFNKDKEFVWFDAEDEEGVVGYLENN